MTPLHFGSPQRRLFGLLHRAEPAPARRGAVLLAMPFGHEAVRTHRLHRVLADRLARTGHDVLRFDWYGTGDADGDDADVSLGGWRDDLLAAHATLARHTGAAAVCWLASRLGAAAALQLVCRGLLPPQVRLRLWDPVLDGSAYLEALRRKHVQALEASFSLPSRRWAQHLADPIAYTGEAIGFAIAPRLRQEVLAVAAAGLVLPRDADVALVCSPGSADAIGWARRQQVPPPLALLERDFDWTSDDSLNTALVPGDALLQLLTAIDGPAR